MRYIIESNCNFHLFNFERFCYLSFNTHTMIYNVLIYDEIPLIGIGLKEVITSKLDFCEVYIAKSSEEFLQYTTILTFDLIFVDITINGINEFSLIVKTNKVQPNTKLILFTFLECEVFNIRSFTYGADAILKKKCSEKNIHQVIDFFLFGGNNSKSLAKEYLELKANR